MSIESKIGWKNPGKPRKSDGWNEVAIQNRLLEYYNSGFFH